MVYTVEELVAPELAPTTDLVLARETVQLVAAELATRYASISLADLSTAEGLENVKRDHAQMVKFRNALDKRRLAVNKMTNGGAAEIQGWFTPTETRVKAVLDEYKKKEDARIEQERLARIKLVGERESALFAMRAIWNGSQYQLGTVFCSKADLELDLLEWAAIKEKFAVERAALDIESKRLALAELVKTRKLELLEMGAVAGFFDTDGEPCDAAALGARYGLKLGDAWAEKHDLERSDEEYTDGTLADFAWEKKQIDDAAALARQKKAEENARLDAIEKQRKLAESAPVLEFEKPVVPETKLQVVDGDAVANPEQSKGAPAVVIQEVVSPKAEPVVESAGAVDRSVSKLVPRTPQNNYDAELYLSGAFNLKRLVAAKVKQAHGVDVSATVDALFTLMAEKYGFSG